MDPKDTTATAGAGSTRFVTIDPIGEPRRVVWLDKEDRRTAHRGPRSCQELGICQGRYPACGQCDDDHSADEPPSPSSFESIWAWLVTGFWLVVAFALVGAAAGYATARLLAP
jgi:hypothetical protein